MKKLKNKLLNKASLFHPTLVKIELALLALGLIFCNYVFVGGYLAVLMMLPTALWSWMFFMTQTSLRPPEQMFEEAVVYSTNIVSCWSDFVTQTQNYYVAARIKDGLVFGVASEPSAGILMYQVKRFCELYNFIPPKEATLREVDRVIYDIRKATSGQLLTPK